MSYAYQVTLLMKEFVTHDVRRFIVTKPDGFTFEPGEGVELAINQKGLSEEGRPFTPTSLKEDGVIEFMIKRYPSHEGVTDKLHNLQPGAELLMSDTFGTIKYKGPGVFIAGGAGITPFISILRQQQFESNSRSNMLLFANKTVADIICEKELSAYLGEDCVLTCTAEGKPGYENRRIDKQFLAEKITDFEQPFYICGPPGMMDAVNKALEELGASPQQLVFEQ